VGTGALEDLTAFDPAAQTEFAAERTSALSDLAGQRNTLIDDLTARAQAGDNEALTQLRGILSEDPEALGDFQGTDLNIPRLRESIAGGPDVGGLRGFQGGAAEDLQRLRDFDPSSVLNSPIFKTLSDDVQRRLFANQAAKGKLGSGETGVRLGERLLPLGLQFAESEFGRLRDVATISQQGDRDDFGRQLSTEQLALRNQGEEFDRNLRSANFDLSTQELQQRAEQQDFSQKLQSVEFARGLRRDQTDALLREAGVTNQQEVIAFQNLLSVTAAQEDITNSEFNRELRTIATQSGITTDRMNQILALVGIGQTAATGQAQAGLSVASNVADIQQGIGNVEAGGLIGAASANRSFLLDLLKIGASAIPGGGGASTSPPPSPPTLSPIK